VIVIRVLVIMDDGVMTVDFRMAGSAIVARRRPGWFGISAPAAVALSE
jgi:hypothetical protein